MPFAPHLDRVAFEAAAGTWQAVDASKKKELVEQVHSPSLLPSLSLCRPLSIIKPILSLGKVNAILKSDEDLKDLLLITTEADIYPCNGAKPRKQEEVSLFCAQNVYLIFLVSLPFFVLVAPPLALFHLNNPLTHECGPL